jgi:myosin heavy subunit
MLSTSIKAFLKLSTAWLFFASTVLFSGQGAYAKPRKPNSPSSKEVVANSPVAPARYSDTTVPPLFSFKDDDAPRAPSSDMTANTEMYPDGALRAAYEAELAEIKKAEEKERELAKQTEIYESRKNQAEEQIQRYKQKMVESRMKSEKSQELIELMKIELVEIEGKQQDVAKQLQSIEEQSKVEMASHSEVSQKLEATRSKLSSALKSLSITRDETSQRVHQAQVEMEQFRTRIARNESDISRIQNDKVRAESEELRVRTEWASVSARNKELQQEKARLLRELDETTANLSKARKDYAQLKRETDQLQFETNHLSEKNAVEKAKALSEMRRIEENIAMANNTRVRNEAEQARLKAESERIRAELASAKRRHDNSLSDLSVSTASVMESRLSFETAKADMANEYSRFEQAKLERDTKNIRMRNIASMVEDSELGEKGQSYKALSDCTLYRGPASIEQPVGKVKKGTKVLASPAEGNWYKVLNASGKPQFLDSSCLDK